jgi:hypothetical protein
MRLGEMTDEQLEDEAKEHDRNGQTEAAAQLRAYMSFRPRLSVFDAFISNPNWYMHPPTYGQLFHQAPFEVVWMDAFSPEHMADYLRRP